MSKLCIDTIKDIVTAWEDSEQMTIEEFAQDYLSIPTDVTNEYWEEFWSTYPRKVGKKVAERRFKKLSLNHQQLAIMRIPKYKIIADMYGQDYLHPSTYINQARFLDEDLVDIPSSKDIKDFLTAPMKVFGLPLGLNEHHILKAAKLIMKHKATTSEAKMVSQWMNDVWGSSAEWKQYVNLNTLLNESKWKERVFKAKDHLNGK